MRDSAPLLGVLMLFQIASGQVLNASATLLFATPVLLVLVPAVNAVGGNVGSILGARLASGLHVGSIPPDLRGREVRRNVAAALVAGLVTFLFVGAMVAGGAWLLEMDLGLGAGRLLAVLVTSGMLLTVSLILIAAGTAYVAFRRGMDPDNAVIPVVTSLGDLMGVVWLIVVYGVMT